MLYSAAETVRVRTLPDMRLHQLTWIGCGDGCESSVTRMAYVVQGLSDEIGRRSKAMTQGSIQTCEKRPM